MRGIAALLIVGGFICAANAADKPSDKPARYLLHLRVKEATANASGDGKTIAEPSIVTVADRPAVFHTGGQTQFADETIRAGTLLKVTIKKLTGDKVRISGMLEVSNFIHPPSQNLVQREATEYYFDRTVKLTETIRLTAHSKAEGGRVVEVTCHQADSLESGQLSAGTK